MITSFYNEEELAEIGLAQIGHNVKISRYSQIYGPENIYIGNNVRIDDFCILSGKINIGNYVHIAAYSALYGGREGIQVGDFSCLSSRVSVYGVSDDYSGATMTNPTIPDEYKNVTEKAVHIGRHVIVGSTSVILPGVEIADGGSFGAFSLIDTDTETWTRYVGIPIRKIGERKRDLLELEKNLREINM